MRLEKRSLSLHGHRTSVALETDFWTVIDGKIQEHERSLAGFLAEIDDQRIAERSSLGLAAYLRVWCLNEVQQKLKKHTHN